jgi:hypothetical protein
MTARRCLRLLAALLAAGACAGAASAPVDPALLPDALMLRSDTPFVTASAVLVER